MQPSRTVFNAVANLLAADVATIGLVAGLKVKLCTAPFVPALDLDMTTLTEASFPGYAALTSGPGPQKSYYDAGTNLRTIDIAPPIGGWHWVATADPAAPQTITGYFVTDVPGLILMGSALLQPQLTISKGGQGFDLDAIQLRFLANSPN